MKLTEQPRDPAHPTIRRFFVETSDLPPHLLCSMQLPKPYEKHPDNKLFMVRASCERQHRQLTLWQHFLNWLGYEQTLTPTWTVTCEYATKEAVELMKHPQCVVGGKFWTRREPSSLLSPLPRRHRFTKQPAIPDGFRYVTIFSAYA